MKYFDLEAEIIPGDSAAGFSLGMKCDDILQMIDKYESITYIEGFNLVKAINSNAGILYIKNYFPKASGNSAIYYKNDTISLKFNKTGVLYEIFVTEGYKGEVLKSFQIGSNINDINKIVPLVYDDGDEMFYPDYESNIQELPKGIAFYADEESLELNLSEKVFGISIHDWNLK